MNRNGFIAYLESKDFALKTITTHVKYAEQFLAKAGKEDIQVTKPDVLKFLEHLKNKGLQNAYRSHYLVALNHYFTFLCSEEQITVNPCLFLKIRGINKRKLHKIYTSEELEQLFDNYHQLLIRACDDSHIPHHKRQQAALSRERNAVMLSILIYQGTATGEIERMEINDIDLIKATLSIRSGRRGNARNLPLKAVQIGLLMNYLQNIRPKLLEYRAEESNKLFLPLPSVSRKETDRDGLRYAFYSMTEQLKTIDKNFKNVLQIRASVITYWIKTLGLRKAQYLAGHRYIGTTEKYVSNNLDNLTNDINKLHPFL